MDVALSIHADFLEMTKRAGKLKLLDISPRYRNKKNGHIKV